MEVSILTDELVPLSVKFNGSTLKLEYRLGEINDDFYDWAKERDEDGKIANTNVDIIERLVAKWNLNIKGEPIEIKAEVLRELKLPTSFYKAIGDAIMEDSSPKSMTAKPLRGGSARKAASARS